VSLHDDNAAARPAQPGIRRGSLWALALLTLVYVVAFIDRQLMNLLLIPIQQFHHLSDTAMSVLIGAAFTSAYVVMGIPVGLWMDRGARRTLVIAGGVMWCVGTTSMAWAGSYAQLFLARLCVGGAEAAIFPGGSSLIAGYFSRERLPRAMSIFLLAPFIGGGLALIFGGLLIAAARPDTGEWLDIAHLAPWQRVFALIGIAGLVPVLLLLTLREPPRVTPTPTGRFNPLESLQFFAKRWRFYEPFYIGVGAGGILSYGVPAWAPTFLIREFAQSTRTVGVSYGSVTLVCGICGVLAGPSIGRRFAHDGSNDGMMRAMASALLLCVPACAALPFLHSYHAAVAVLALITFLYTVPISIGASALQLATPDPVRAAAAALFLIVVALIGASGGPLFVSLLSQGVRLGLGASLAIACSTGALIAAALFWLGHSHYVGLLGEGNRLPSAAVASGRRIDRGTSHT
jgi:MFS transporter, Spinster family, sphingosine-1-phosphate transporter